MGKKEKRETQKQTNKKSPVFAKGTWPSLVLEI